MALTLTQRRHHPLLNKLKQNHHQTTDFLLLLSAGLQCCVSSPLLGVPDLPDMIIRLGRLTPGYFRLLQVCPASMAVDQLSLVLN